MIIDYAKKCEKGMMISSILTLILGIVLAIEPTGSLQFITYVIASIAILIGVVFLFDYVKQSREEKMMSTSLVFSLIFLSVGIFLFCNSKSLVSFITVLIGVTIVIKSLFKLQFALNLKGISEKWKYNLLAGIITLALGVLLLLNPFESAVVFLRIIGIVLAVGSIIELIETTAVLHTLDDVKELPFEEKKPKKEKK